MGVAFLFGEATSSRLKSQSQGFTVRTLLLRMARFAMGFDPRAIGS
jgi:hypothetical protein